VTQIVTFVLTMMIAPIAALALLIGGLNGTARLLDLFADRKHS